VKVLRFRRSPLVHMLRVLLDILWTALSIAALLAGAAAVLGLSGFAARAVVLAARDVLLAALGTQVNRSPVAIGAAVVTLAILGLATAMITWHMRVMRTPARWPTARGVITATRVDEWRGRACTFFEPVVEYAYTVDGRQFTSTRFWYKALRYEDDRAAAEENFAKFDPGSEVTVRYDASHPSRSVVKFGEPSAVVFVVAMVTMMLVFDGTEASAHDSTDWVTAFVGIAIVECISLAWLIHRTREKVDTFGSE
jgi:hypothetical protein